MTLPPDDWPRLKDAFAGARALPKDERPAYLAAACDGNEALRHEVESLLSSDERAKSFLEAPAVVLGDDPRATRNLEGQRIGPYEIASRIGAGGMGEVYQARDTTLNRQVAIKVLLPGVASDPDRLARFRREARVLASLNHPHIAQIHGFEDADGVHALVMELVEGPTLADRIVSGAIPINEALAIRWTSLASRPWWARVGAQRRRVPRASTAALVVDLAKQGPQHHARRRRADRSPFRPISRNVAVQAAPTSLSSSPISCYGVLHTKLTASSVLPDPL